MFKALLSLPTPISNLLKTSQRSVIYCTIFWRRILHLIRISYRLKPSKYSGDIVDASDMMKTGRIDGQEAINLKTNTSDSSKVSKVCWINFNRDWQWTSRTSLHLQLLIISQALWPLCSTKSVASVIKLSTYALSDMFQFNTWSFHFKIRVCLAWLILTLSWLEVWRSYLRILLPLDTTVFLGLKRRFVSK